MEKTEGLEEKIKKLENIANELENGDKKLDDAIKNFEDGVKLAKECLDGLKQTSGKIAVLKKEMETLIEKPFDDNDGGNK